MPGERSHPGMGGCSNISGGSLSKSLTCSFMSVFKQPHGESGGAPVDFKAIAFHILTSATFKTKQVGERPPKDTLVGASGLENILPLTSLLPHLTQPCRKGDRQTGRQTDANSIFQHGVLSIGLRISSVPYLST